MLVLVFIALSFVASIVVRFTCPVDDYYDSFDRITHWTKWNLVSKIISIVSVGLFITSCILCIITFWNPFTLPIIAFFVSWYLYIWFKEWDETCVLFWIVLLISVISFCVILVMYLSNIKEAEEKEVTVASQNIVCVKDGDSVEGGVSGGIFFVYGQVSGKSVYKYYYQIEDGGFRQGSIPADSTTIYYLEDGENPHLDTIVTKTVLINYNNNPPTDAGTKDSKTTYKIYVPKGSVTNVYEFDAE